MELTDKCDIISSYSNEQDADNSASKCSSDWWLICDDVTKSDLVLLQKSLGELKANKIDSVVTAAFTQLFDNHPTSFAVFVTNHVLPKTRDEVAYSWETRRHGYRVMHAFEKCLTRLDKPRDLTNFIRQIAETHIRYGVKPTDVLSLIGCFKCAIKAELVITASVPSPPSSISIASSGMREEFYLKSFELPVAIGSAETVAWAKFFRIIGLALVAEIIRNNQRDESANQDGTEERCEILATSQRSKSNLCNKIKAHFLQHKFAKYREIKKN